MNQKTIDLSPEFFKRKLELLAPTFGKATLMAVSKHVNFETIKNFWLAGQKDFGENRIEVLEEKAQLAWKEKLALKWHFIGKLQSNKVKRLLLVPNLKSIHSVDRIKICHELLKHADLLENKKIHLFFQMNTSGEKEKSGFASKKEMHEAMELFRGHEWFIVSGIMTMATLRTNDLEASAEECFKALRDVCQLLSKDFKNLKLCMGMSADYKVAVGLGSDWLRIGTLLYS